MDNISSFWRLLSKYEGCLTKLQHSFQLGFNNVMRIARLHTIPLGLLIIGYFTTILSVFIVLGVAEGEHVLTYERYGGNPSDLYEIYLIKTSSMPPETDYNKVIKILSERSDITQIIAYVRELPQSSADDTNTVSLVGYKYIRSPKWPSLAWGRHFSQQELVEGSNVVVVSPNVPSILENEIEYAMAFGERWQVVGKMALSSPRTGQLYHLLNDLYIVPLSKFANIASEKGVNATFRIFIPNHLSNKEHEDLLLSLKQAAPGYSVSLIRYMENNTVIWQNRLIALAIAIVIIGFALANLLALVRYWVRRRSYEVAVRLCSGASRLEVNRMFYGEQLILVTIAYIVGLTVFGISQSTISRTGLIVASSPVQIAIVGILAFGIASIATKLSLREIGRINVTKLLRGVAM